MASECFLNGRPAEAGDLKSIQIRERINTSSGSHAQNLPGLFG